VKDSASQLNKNFYRVMLFSGIDGLGKEFFGKSHPPCNLHKNDDEFAFLNRTFTRLLRFNIWVDAVLERRGNYFVIRDTELKNC
jgi:hypothetical protein